MAFRMLSSYVYIGSPVYRVGQIRAQRRQDAIHPKSASKIKSQPFHFAKRKINKNKGDSDPSRLICSSSQLNQSNLIVIPIAIWSNWSKMNQLSTKSLGVLRKVGALFAIGSLSSGGRPASIFGLSFGGNPSLDFLRRPAFAGYHSLATLPVSDSVNGLTRIWS